MKSIVIAALLGLISFADAKRGRIHHQALINVHSTATIHDDNVKDAEDEAAAADKAAAVEKKEVDATEEKIQEAKKEGEQEKAVEGLKTPAEKKEEVKVAGAKAAKEQDDAAGQQEAKEEAAAAAADAEDDKLGSSCFCASDCIPLSKAPSLLHMVSTKGEGDRLRFQACLLVLALLSGQAVALHRNILHSRSSHASTANSVSATSAEPQMSMEDFEKAVQRGREMEHSLRCEQLPGGMSEAIKLAKATLGKVCSGDKSSCDLLDVSEVIIEDLVADSLRISAIASVADKKHCLGPTMDSDIVQSNLTHLLDMFPAVLDGAGSNKANKQMQQAQQRLMSWQYELLELANVTLDRKLLFPRDIENADNCPEPCTSCTVEHNSFYKDAEEFKFKCILDGADDVPSKFNSELACTQPQRRWSRPWQFKTWCSVTDWKLHAYQHNVMSAQLTCGAQSIFSPMIRGREMPEGIYKTCLAVEQDIVVPKKESQAYQAFAMETNSRFRVPAGATSAFAVFLSAGLAQGLGALRLASTGNNRGLSHTPVELLEAFGPLPRTRNGIFSNVSAIVERSHAFVDSSCHLNSNNKEPLHVSVGRVLLSLVGGALGVLVVGVIMVYIVGTIVLALPTGLATVGGAIIAFAALPIGVLLSAMAFRQAGYASYKALGGKVGDCMGMMNLPQKGWTCVGPMLTAFPNSKEYHSCAGCEGCEDWDPDCYCRVTATCKNSTMGPIIESGGCEYVDVRRRRHG